MIEMLGVLAIVGVLSVGGIMAYNMAMNRFQIGQQQDQLSLLMTNIRTTFTRGNYTGLNNAVAQQFGFVSCREGGAVAVTTANTGCTVNNVFGGLMNVGYNSGALTGALGSAAPGGSFWMAVNNVPRGACSAIISSFWGDSTSGLLDIRVNPSPTAAAEPGGSTIFTRGAGNAEPPTNVEALTICGAQGSAIIFDMR